MRHVNMFRSLHQTAKRSVDIRFCGESLKHILIKFYKVLRTHHTLVILAPDTFRVIQYVFIFQFVFRIRYVVHGVSSQMG